jgi:hypothetical protein
MNQTPNLSLCQWDPEDRIQREDFNNDNSKIDTALANLQTQAARFVKLREIVTEQNVTVGQIEVDVSDIHFADWQYVHVDIYDKGYTSIYFRVNDEIDNCHFAYPSETGGYGSTGCLANVNCNIKGKFEDRITLLVGRQGNREVTTRCAEYCGTCPAVLFQDLKKLVFASASGASSSNPIQAGTTIIIWGEA